MDAGVLGRSSSATMEGTDLKAVRHRQWGVFVRFIALLVARNSAALAEG